MVQTDVPKEQAVLDEHTLDLPEQQVQTKAIEQVVKTNKNTHLG